MEKFFFEQHQNPNRFFQNILRTCICTKGMLGMRSNITTLLSLLICLLLLSCQVQEKAHLGEIELEVTGQKEAIPHFREGLLLLHSFEYDDAREAFEKAVAADPDMVMAYWGIVMSHNHGLWRQQAFDKATTVLQQLGQDQAERLARAKTDLEKDFLMAAEVMYGDGTKLERDQAYADHMAMMFEKYPGQHEVAAFYALSLLGAVPVGRDEEMYEKGARIANGILEENPQHPGALHYLIHSYDDPSHARLALKAANNYSKVAPDAAHALHMPSHIYVAMGMWVEVINSNISSYQASLSRKDKKKLDGDARSYHALAWLLYGQLQQENWEEADKIMADMEAYTTELPSKRAKAYMVEMKANYLVETNRWDSPVANIEVETDNLNLTNQAGYEFIEGVKAYQKKNAAALRQVILGIAQLRQDNGLLINEEGAAVCSAAGIDQTAPNQMDLDLAQIMEMELRAYYHWLGGDAAETEKWLIEATNLESKVSYSFGPPIIAKPSYELYGDWLVEQGRLKEAIVQYELALERGPNRTYPLKAKAKAAEGSDEEKLSMQ